MPDYRDTIGPEIGAVATLAGFPPDPEQQMLLDHANGIDRDGKSVAFEVVVIAPRQNLKTGFFKQQALGDLFVRQERLVVWSAHEFDTAQEALTDLETLIDGSDLLRSRVAKITHGAVPEIQLTPKWGRARMKFKTRTSGGGRGLSGRKVNLDEGYALQAGQVGALYPIMLAQPDPQVRVGSSACRPESAVLSEMVNRGRRGGELRMFYAEWCGPAPDVACERGADCDHSRGTPGCGCDKPELIEGIHSAIRRGRILLQTVLDLRSSMPPAEYGREIMGWHDDTEVGASAFDMQRWNDLTDPNSSAERILAFGVEISIDRVSAAIGAAGPKPDVDGVLHLEHVAQGRGTSWIVARCVELDEQHGPSVFAVDGDGPASELVPELEQAGLRVVVMSTRDVGNATAGLVDGVNDGTVSHGPQIELDQAMAGAKKRPLGDGRFALGRRASNLNIAPAVAVRNAHWAAVNESVEVLNSIW